MRQQCLKQASDDPTCSLCCRRQWCWRKWQAVCLSSALPVAAASPVIGTWSDIWPHTWLSSPSAALTVHMLLVSRISLNNTFARSTQERRSLLTLKLSHMRRTCQISCINSSINHTACSITYELTSNCTACVVFMFYISVDGPYWLIWIWQRPILCNKSVSTLDKGKTNFLWLFHL